MASVAIAEGLVKISVVMSEQTGSSLKTSGIVLGQKGNSKTDSEAESSSEASLVITGLTENPGMTLAVVIG